MEGAEQFVFPEPPADTMSESANLLTPPQDRSRNFRSQSLKTQNQPFLFPTRPKRRTLSLPSKPVIPPFIIIQGCQGNREESDSEEHELSCESNKESMAWYTPIVGLSCSLVIYFWSCALAYYSAR